MDKDINNEINDLTEIFGMFAKSSPAVNTIKMCSPTTKINMINSNNQENKSQIIGMGLLIRGFRDLEIDIENLNIDTIIYISDYQKIEALNIIDGSLSLLLNNNIIGRDEMLKITNFIMEIKNFYTYGDFLYSIDKLESTLDFKKDMMDRLISIIKNIWFVPYHELDKLYDEVIKDFENSKKGNKDE